LIKLRLITNERILVRIISLWLIGLAVLFVAWTVSYVSLPEGSMRGTVIVSYIPLKAAEVYFTFIRIFLYNLLVAVGSLILANLIKVKGYPLGYLVLFYHWVLYGAFLGTNSFMIPTVTRLFPSLETLFRGSGIYEITSYTLIAAATYAVGVSVESIGSSRGEFHLLNNFKLSKIELAVIVLAVLLLAVANYLEAWQIFHS